MKDESENTGHLNPDETDKNELLEMGKPLLEESDEPSNEHGDIMPYNAYIGHYANIKESEVREYVYSYAEKNFDTLTNVFYQIVKHKDGYSYEIHQGGIGRGFLSSILTIIGSGNISALLSSSAKYKIYEREGNIRTLKLRQDDLETISDLVIPTQKDRLKPLITRGYAFHVFGLTISVIGIIALLISFSFKYLIINQDEIVYFTSSGKYTPMSYISEVNKINRSMQRNDEYITSLTYKFKSKVTPEDNWVVNKEKVVFDDVKEDITNKEIETEDIFDDPEINGGYPKLKDKYNKRNSRKLTVGEGEI
jgi:hypothetical protein